MSEVLVPAVTRPAVVPTGSAAMALPAVIVDVGPVAVERFLEFFAASISNGRTRAAYGRAVGRFLSWCAARGLGLREIAPLHVAAYIRTHPGSAPTVKQHLAAIRVLGDWLVVPRVSAVVGMRRQDYFLQGTRGWLRLHEKGGKRHDVPAHHRAAAAVDAYLVAGGIADAKAPLFQSIHRSRRASLFVRAVAADAPSGQQSKIRAESG